MSIITGYQRQEQASTPRVGKLRCAIVDVQESTSKASGRPMLVVTVQPSNSKAQVKTYIVKNDNFNRNLTQLYDAFPSIPEGSDNFVEWIGAIGAADFAIDDRGYLKVKWFVTPDKVANLPPFEGDVPQQQLVTKIGDDVAEDGLPF